MKTKTIQTYSYDELNPKAQARARDWFREGSAGETSFGDAVIEDAEAIAELLGITFAQREFKTVGGKTGSEPKIYWSGFSRQGDGACFEGTWSAIDVQPGKTKDYAPVDKELHRIAAEFERLAKAFPEASFSVKQRGHYYHKMCTEFDVTLVTDEHPRGDLTDDQLLTEEENLIEVARDFMDWIYTQLETAYEYDQKDETVADNIRAYEYEFTAEGNRSVIL